MSSLTDGEPRLTGNRPYRKSAVDREGSRWRDGEPFSQEPIDEFLDFNSVFLSDLLQIAEETLSSFLLPLQLGTSAAVLPGSNTYVLSGRVKSTSSLLQKLRRMKTTPLSNIQDIAGFRFDCSLTLTEQTKVAEAFKNAFLLEGAKRADVRDLREDSHSGYRAVHLHIRSDLGRAEMQIRSALQSKWANLYEEAADIYGRDIRYLHELGFSIPAGAEEITAELHELSALVKKVEDLVDEGQPELKAKVNALEADVYGILDRIHETLKESRIRAGGRS